MSGVPARRKELLVGCGAEVESEDQARSVHPPHSYPYPKAYCALSSPNSSCLSLLLELPLLLLPLPAATAEECKAQLKVASANPSSPTSSLSAPPSSSPVLPPSPKTLSQRPEPPKKILGTPKTSRQHYLLQQNGFFWMMLLLHPAMIRSLLSRTPKNPKP